MHLIPKDIYGLVATGHGIAALTFFVAVLMGSLFLYATSEVNWKHVKISAIVGAIAYMFTFGLGLVMYPLRTGTSIASSFFEIKVGASSIAFFLAIAVLYLAVFGRLTKASRKRRIAFGGLFASLVVFGMSSMIIAFIVGHLRG